MTCFHPLESWQWKGVSEHGEYKTFVLFKKPSHPSISPLLVPLPCGQCIGCRLERSRQWAIRCVHEASLHDNNIFITLTYDDEHLPKDNSLNVRHFQLFIKKLRKKLGLIDEDTKTFVSDATKNLRYYHCGEYGDRLGRPHYHAILFNLDFNDKLPIKKTGDTTLYTSPLLEKIWGNGLVSIGDVTFESAAYVARYVMKKINGENADTHYTKIDAHGNQTLIQPEYTTMSRRPGIGGGWLKHYTRDVYPLDRVIMRGMSLKPPRYYDNLLKTIDYDLLENLKQERQQKAEKNLDDNTPERLKVKEAVCNARLQQLKRNL